MHYCYAHPSVYLRSTAEVYIPIFQNCGTVHHHHVPDRLCSWGNFVFPRGKSLRNEHISHTAYNQMYNTPLVKRYLTSVSDASTTYTLTETVTYNINCHLCVCYSQIFSDVCYGLFSLGGKESCSIEVIYIQSTMCIQISTASIVSLSYRALHIEMTSMCSAMKHSKAVQLLSSLSHIISSHICSQYGMVSFGIACSLVIGFFIVLILGGVFAGLLTG